MHHSGTTFQPLLLHRRKYCAKLTLVKNAFLIILLGAALLVPSFAQAAGTTNTPTLTSSTVTLRWDKSHDRHVKGYRLHCGLTSGRNYSRFINVGNVTTYTLSNLIPGKTYYCVVRAYNASVRKVGRPMRSPLPLRRPPVVLNLLRLTDIKRAPLK